MVNIDEVYRRYQELQAWVGWTDECARRVAATAELLTPHLPTLINDSYEEIDRHPNGRSEAITIKERYSTMNSPTIRKHPPQLLELLQAKNLMSPNPVSILRDATVREAVALMTDRGFGAAPVIDEAGRPVGVVSRTDVPRQYR